MHFPVRTCQPGNSSAFASVRLDILIHIIKVIINLLDPVRAANSGDSQLVPLVPVLIILDVASIGSVLLLLLGVLQPAPLVPDLQGAPGHHNETLNIILKPGSLTAAERVESADSAAQLAFLVLLDNVEGLTGNASVTGACAVMFDENCCKSSDDYYVVPRGEKGKLCGTRSGLNPLSSCKSRGLKDDIEALLVLPGCKLEVWDKGSGLEDAEKEERKGFRQGDYKDQVDRYDRNKLVFTADRSGPHWVEEINDDFDDMDEDIESFRCTCN